LKNDRIAIFKHAKRVIVKVGSNVLTADNGLNLKAIRSISRQICTLIDEKRDVILVSSGAMASGINKVGLPKRPDEIPKRQAVAAIGQAGLIMEYEKAFARHDKQVAQILLISDDMSYRQRYLNVRNTMYTLLSWKVVPIINENDTVMVEEIKFGDNDNLAAMIALLLNADILINLTDIEGLCNKDPRIHPNATLIPTVSSIKKDIEKFAGTIPGPLGAGGMLSKIKAAKKVTSAGIPMVIANGEKPNILQRLFAGQELGTFFVPKKEKLASRKRWIGFSLKPKGSIVIDQGAAEALLKGGKSLLPSGIVSVEGKFTKGAPVDLKAARLGVMGTGLVNYGSEDICKIMGLKSTQIKSHLGNKPYDEVIHRDNLVITL